MLSVVPAPDPDLPPLTQALPMVLLRTLPDGAPPWLANLVKMSQAMMVDQDERKVYQGVCMIRDVVGALCDEYAHLAPDMEDAAS